MAMSELRKELHARGITDEHIFFDDTPDGTGIIPRFVLDADKVVVVESIRKSPVPQAETHDLSGSPDNLEQVSDCPNRKHEDNLDCPETPLSPREE